MGGEFKTFFVQVAAFAAVVVGTLTGQPWLVAIGVSITAKNMSALVAGGLTRRTEGALLNIASNEASMPVVYGRTKVGLRVVDVRVDTASQDDKDLALVGALSLGGEGGQGIEDVEAVYFDDHLAISNPVFESEPSTSGVQSRYSGFLEYGLHAGADAQTVDAELDSRFTAWGTDSPGKGIAYIALFLTYDRDIFPNGIPNVTVVMNGVQPWDPRASGGAGAWQYSNNAALCVLDYLTSERYGGGAFYPERDGGDTTLSEIDEDSFTTAANFCEEQVSKPPSGTEDRFTCDGVVDTERSVAQNLLELLSACRGALIYEGGKFRLVIRKVTTASGFELNEDNIIGDWQYDVLGSRDVPNVVRATYVDEDQNWQPNTVQWPEADAANAYLTNDNGLEVAREIDLPFTQGRYRAGRVAMVNLKEGRADVIVSCLAKEEALKLQVGDVVPVTHSSPGWSQRDNWVAAVGIRPNGTVRLWLQEYDASAYTLESQSQADTPPGTELPDPFTVQPPTNLVLVANSQTAISTQGGQVVPAINVSWTGSVHPFLDHYELQFRRNIGGQEWTEWANPALEDDAAVIWPVQEGQQYQVRLRAVNTFGVVSDWVQGNVTPTTYPGAARVTNISPRFDPSDDSTILSLIGNVYCANMYVRVGIGSPPADPTDVSNDGSVAGTSGTVDTGVVCNIAQTAYIKARGYNSEGDPGPVMEITVTRTTTDYVAPDFSTKPSQSGDTGTLDIEIFDPQGRVNGTAFKKHEGPGDFDLSDPDDASWSTDFVAPYATTFNCTIQAKHGSRIAGAIRYQDEGGTNRWLIKVEEFDLDFIAEVDSVAAWFDEDDHLNIDAKLDEDGVGGNGYVKVAIGGDPPDPTAAANDGSWSGREGNVDTGVVCNPGQVAHYKVRGRNSDGDYGPIIKKKLRNGDVPRVELVTETLAATTLTLTVRSFTGDTEAGIVEHRAKSDGVTWQTDFDGDLSDESTEGPVAVSRPAYGADPDWIEFRAKVSGKRSTPMRVEIPPQDPPNVWDVEYSTVSYTATQATIEDATAFKNGSSTSQVLQFKDGDSAWADAPTNPDDIVVDRPLAGETKVVILAVKDGTDHRSPESVAIQPRDTPRVAKSTVSNYQHKTCGAGGSTIDVGWWHIFYSTSDYYTKITQYVDDVAGISKTSKSDTDFTNAASGTYSFPTGYGGGLGTKTFNYLIEIYRTSDDALVDSLFTFAEITRTDVVAC